MKEAVNVNLVIKYRDKGEEKLKVVRTKFMDNMLWYTLGGTHEKYIPLDVVKSVEWCKEPEELTDPLSM